MSQRTRATIWGLLLLMLLSMLACESATLTPGSPVLPPAVTSEALQPTVEWLQVAAYAEEIEAQQMARDAQSTLTVLYAQQTATAAAVYATETAFAQHATATASAQQATATAQAEQHIATATAVAHSIQATATAQSQNLAATATASAARATATVEAILFQQASTATAAAWAVESTATTEALHAQATIEAAQAERVRLAAERDRIVTPLRAYGPWLILILAALLILWGGYRLTSAYEMRVRAIPRDARGDARVLILQQGGNLVAFDPDRSFGPATVFGQSITQPQLAPPEIQEKVTARDQAVDLAHRGVLQATRAPRERCQREAIARAMTPSPYRLLQPGAAPPPMLVDGAVIKALDVDWQEVNDES